MRLTDLVVEWNWRHLTVRVRLYKLKLKTVWVMIAEMNRWRLGIWAIV